MPAAARLGDKTSHGGAIGPPPASAAAVVSTVLIGGKPAAVVGSTHICVVPPHAALGPANVVTPRPAATGLVLIGGLPAAKAGDSTTCQATILLGEMTVQIGGAL
ncbi:PAAR domain-containing protein [Actinokineospora iranica]|uniref:Zn-binding Pro-Ala-Ala-Arg (PAAR) domain-containing protein, incolved in TypeVI secretion n=1 Tax=Actinokineospora iranica TaxID=1271860 RepID=A0A1G6TYG3_9PSEU|nr:PAAR domain-containing protein [Actinokineospora iranica]SDD33974.1 Zn-binding Pro-Ala-Ala-Arg (PAAR) domain-containing protein, incolved in TypeVI secretion [Actinokineospora iranica]